MTTNSLSLSIRLTVSIQKMNLSSKSQPVMKRTSALVPFALRTVMWEDSVLETTVHIRALLALHLLIPATILIYVQWLWRPYFRLRIRSNRSNLSRIQKIPLLLSNLLHLRPLLRHKKKRRKFKKSTNIQLRKRQLIRKINLNS